jgi:hypothetical protein
MKEQASPFLSNTSKLLALNINKILFRRAMGSAWLGHYVLVLHNKSLLDHMQMAQQDHNHQEVDSVRFQQTTDDTLLNTCHMHF